MIIIFALTDSFLHCPGHHLRWSRNEPNFLRHWFLFFTQGLRNGGWKWNISVELIIFPLLSLSCFPTWHSCYWYLSEIDFFNKTSRKSFWGFYRFGWMCQDKRNANEILSMENFYSRLTRGNLLFIEITFEPNRNSLFNEKQFSERFNWIGGARYLVICDINAFSIWADT